MKTFYGTTLDVGVVDALRETALRLKVPVGELLALCVRHSLARFNDDALKKWASGVDEKRGKPAGGLKRKERALLDAFKSLAAKSPGVVRFAAGELADAAGLRGAVGYLALQDLERRGFARGIVDAKAGDDRWGRPLVSYWTLTPEGAAAAG